MDSIKKLLDLVFMITMALFIVLSFIIVFGQVFALVTLNGALAAFFKSTLLKPTCMICSVTGIAAYIMSYIYKWKMGD
ncbi:MAG: cobalt ABC transporter substrate-binding protein [Oscillospiraceae bacterium]